MGLLIKFSSLFYASFAVHQRETHFRWMPPASLSVAQCAGGTVSPLPFVLMVHLLGKVVTVPEGVMTLLWAQGFFRIDLETGSQPHLCRHSTRNPCWRERAGKPQQAPADVLCPLSLSVHPGTVPPHSLLRRSWTWKVIGGRQPHQWERSQVASLCWSSLCIMAPRLLAPVRVPMGSTEMMQSWCLEWEKGRAPGLSHPCGWLASGLSLEPTGGPPARYQWSQRLLTPTPQDSQVAPSVVGSSQHFIPSMGLRFNDADVIACSPICMVCWGCQAEQGLLPLVLAVEALGLCSFPDSSLLFFFFKIA